MCGSWGLQTACRGNEVKAQAYGGRVDKESVYASVCEEEEGEDDGFVLRRVMVFVRLLCSQ